MLQYGVEVGASPLMDTQGYTGQMIGIGGKATFYSNGENRCIWNNCKIYLMSSYLKH